MALCKGHQSRFDLTFAEVNPEERITGQVNRHNNSTVGVSELASIGRSVTDVSGPDPTP